MTTNHLLADLVTIIGTQDIVFERLIDSIILSYVKLFD